MPDPRFFKKSGAFSLQQIADLIDGELSDPPRGAEMIEDVASLAEAGPGQVTFFENRKYREQFLATKATACFVGREEPDPEPRSGDEPLVLIRCNDGYAAYGRFAAALYPEPEIDFPDFQGRGPGIAVSATVADSAIVSPTAVVHNGAEVGAESVIGDHVSVGPGVVVGENCRIGANVTLSHCLIGDRVHILPGACIGQRGFGFAPNAGQPVRIPQLGRVIVENDVEIGASTTIDRGSGPDTVIGAGTMIDNLVQIAHNVRVGKGCILVSQVGISGSTEIGDHTVIGGQAGVIGHLKVGNRVQIAGQAGVTRDVDDGQIVGGSPAVPIRQWHRQVAGVQRLAKKG